ncbi:DinB family protein [Aquimarina algiphila]|uniref:DinB family protein n=1 Tax=Aquimarina algiphila TaxID=2047982 RepID=UPI0024902266|nr:DUF664 domain-containing protein [Aquimarina algiphila]
MLIPFFKTFIEVLIFIVSTVAFSQTTKEVSREWVGFSQEIDVKTDKKIKFKLRANLKSVSHKSNSLATLYAWVKNKTEEPGFSEGVQDTILKNPEWTPYEIEGYFDEAAEKLTFGAWVVSEGEFYFDDFELLFQKDDGNYESVTIANPGFEEKITDDSIPGWDQDVDKEENIIKVKGYTFHSSDSKHNGKLALMIRGKGVENNPKTNINKEEGFTPQIGTLIAMLNNLSNRVESVVKNLDVRETDHLLDEKANRIGALIMHLAAAEVYYQVYTFENRSFNKEEKEKWETGLELGEKAREEFKGKSITYYLDIYKEVRKKTIQELEKRNDEWLEESWPGSTMNNHFAWFHVMEHQSSHLGQILMLKKRIPKEENNIKLPEEKVDQ